MRLFKALAFGLVIMMILAGLVIIFAAQTPFGKMLFATVAIWAVISWAFYHWASENKKE